MEHAAHCVVLALSDVQPRAAQQAAIAVHARLGMDTWGCMSSFPPCLHHTCLMIPACAVLFGGLVSAAWRRASSHMNFLAVPAVPKLLCCSALRSRAGDGGRGFMTKPRQQQAHEGSTIGIILSCGGCVRVVQQCHDGYSITPQSQPPGVLTDR